MEIISLLHNTMEHNGQKWIDVLKEVKEDIAEYIVEHELLGECTTYPCVQGGFTLKTDKGVFKVGVYHGRRKIEVSVAPSPAVPICGYDNFELNDFAMKVVQLLMYIDVVYEFAGFEESDFADSNIEFKQLEEGKGVEVIIFK